MTPQVQKLEKLVLDSFNYDKLKAGILAGDPLLKVLAESADLSGLVIGAIEGVGEPYLAELASKNVALGSLEPIVIAALNPALETFVKSQFQALSAKIGA